MLTGIETAKTNSAGKMTDVSGMTAAVTSGVSKLAFPAERTDKPTELEVEMQ